MDNKDVRIFPLTPAQKHLFLEWFGEKTRAEVKIQQLRDMIVADAMLPNVPGGYQISQDFNALIGLTQRGDVNTSTTKEETPASDAVK